MAAPDLECGFQYGAIAHSITGKPTDGRDLSLRDVPPRTPRFTVAWAMSHTDPAMF
jgi:hypothetical protein